MSNFTATPTNDHTPYGDDDHFQPQPDPPTDLDVTDTDYVPPVPNLFPEAHVTGKVSYVHTVPSQRISTRAIFLDTAVTVPQRLVDKAELGIGARVTITVHPTGTGTLYIAQRPDDLYGSGVNPNGVFGNFPTHGFGLPFTAGVTQPPVVQFMTCAEIWGRSFGGNSVLAMVMVEQFYGD